MARPLDYFYFEAKRLNFGLLAIDAPPSRGAPAFENKPQGFHHGDTLRFRLIVVDVCNGGITIYTSKTINVNF